MSIPLEAIRAFLAHRARAKRRGIDFLFSLEDWWAWWQVEDRWSRRGIYKGQLVMARNGDAGPYHPDNVQCLTAGENARDALAKTRLTKSVRGPGGRKPLGNKPLTKTEIQRRWRAKKKRLAAQANARGNEWGTPQDIIDAVRLVLGQIDCDPATHPEAQQRVQAACHYTVADNGLERPWYGRVFLNPPYERGLIDDFVIKLAFECMAGRTTEAIVLVNGQNGTAWFRRLKTACTAECIPDGRIAFLNSDGHPGRPQVGQAIFYWGPKPDRFVEVFHAFGYAYIYRAAPRVSVLSS